MISIPRDPGFVRVVSIRGDGGFVRAISILGDLAAQPGTPDASVRETEDRPGNWQLRRSPDASVCATEHRPLRKPGYRAERLRIAPARMVLILFKDAITLRIR